MSRQESPADLQENAVPDSNEEAFQAMADLLAHMHRKEDTSPLAQRMRECFPSANAMFSASRDVWHKLGLRPNDALFFSFMTEITRYVQRDSFGKHPNISRLSKAAPYLIANSFGLQVECFYVFFLNQRGNLKERILMQRGISDGALFSLRHLLAETVRVAPAALIITHNHPGGTMRPSQDDISCTLDAMRALTVLGIPLLDHVIIVGNEAVSLRDNGFVPEAHWMRQAPDNRFLKNWLLEENAPAKPKRKPRK